MDKTLGNQISANLEKIMADSQLAHTFLKDGVIPYAAGDTLVQRNYLRLCSLWWITD